MCKRCFDKKCDNGFLYICWKYLYKFLYEPTKLLGKIVDEDVYHITMSRLVGDNIKQLVSMMESGQKFFTTYRNWKGTYYLRLIDFSKINLGCDSHYYYHGDDYCLLYT